MIRILFSSIVAIGLATASSAQISAEGPPEADVMLRNAIRQSPEDVSPYFELARLAQQDGELEEALAWVRAVREISKDAEVLSRVESEEALVRDAIRRARETNPESPARVAAKAALAAALDLARQNASATDIAAEFERAIELDPSFPEPRFNLAVLAERSADVATAVHWYEQYIALAPDMPHALVAETRIERLRATPGTGPSTGATSEAYRENLQLALDAMEANQREEAIRRLEAALAEAPPDQRAVVEKTIEGLREDSDPPSSAPAVGSGGEASVQPARAAARPVEVTARPERVPEIIERRVSCSECNATGRCPSCHGAKGWSEACRDCQGTGQIAEDCRHCQSTGATTCQRCRGEGRLEDPCYQCDNGSVTCVDCDGEGTIRGDECMVCVGRGSKRCPCGGSGSVNGETCLVCGGAGEVDCITCFGRGRELDLPCVYCGTDGRADCSRCDGTAVVESSCPECQGMRTTTCQRCSGQGDTSARCTTCRGGETFTDCSQCSRTGRCTTCLGEGTRLERVGR